MQSRRFNGEIMCIKLDVLNPMPGEYFVDITPDIIPGVYPYYMISNYGRLFNKYTSCFIGNNSNPNHYTHCILSGEPNTQIDLHRLVMMVFHPRPDFANMYINHKDGNKTNNRIDNLEWCTASENTIHGYNTGLIPRGEYSACAKLTEAQVRYICELLATNQYSQKEIADMAGCNICNVNDIKQGKWNHIANDYNFTYRNYRLFSEDDVENICLYFQNNPKPDDMTKAEHCRNAMSYIGVDLTSRTVFDSVRKIYDHKQYKSISNKYVF